MNYSMKSYEKINIDICSEFAYELVLALPYANWLYNNDLLVEVNSPITFGVAVTFIIIPLYGIITNLTLLFIINIIS